MLEDPIVKEVRRIREEHSARFGHDLDRIYQALKKREKASGRQNVSYPPRRLEPVGGGALEVVIRSPMIRNGSRS